MPRADHETFDSEAGGDLSALLKLVQRATELGVRVAMPGEVVSYDPVKQKANVKTVILTVAVDTASPTGERVETPVVLPAVPVAWQRTSGGYLTLPLNPGDTGQLIINDRHHAAWMRTGTPSPPEIRHTHGLGDAVFYPGLHDDTDPLPSTDPTDVVLASSAGLKLGSQAATDFAVLATALQTWLAAIVGEAVVVPQDGGAAFKANLVSLITGGGNVTPVPVPPVTGSLIANAASTKVKVAP